MLDNGDANQTVTAKHMREHYRGWGKRGRIPGGVSIPCSPCCSVDGKRDPEVHRKNQTIRLTQRLWLGGPQVPQMYLSVPWAIAATMISSHRKSSAMQLLLHLNCWTQRQGTRGFRQIRLGVTGVLLRHPLSFTILKAPRATITQTRSRYASEEVSPKLPSDSGTNRPDVGNVTRANPTSPPSRQ